jgi:hypothetical protein
MWNNSAVAYFRVVCNPDVLFEALKKVQHFPIKLVGRWTEI